MLNPRISSYNRSFIQAKKDRLVYTPDFSQENVLYRDFGCNNNIDIMRSRPEYEGVINSQLNRIQDVGLDTSDFSDEQLAEGVIGRSYDINEVQEMLRTDAQTRQNELNELNKKLS